MNRKQKIERLEEDLRDERYRHQCTRKQLNDKIVAGLQESELGPKLRDYAVHYSGNYPPIAYRADQLDGFSTLLAVFKRDGIVIGMATGFLYIDSVLVEEATDNQ